MVRFIGQQDAINIDLELFNEYKFSVDQLMELAGLSVACAIAQCYPRKALLSTNILVCCGPGNNGGDGLVCARHLAQFGLKPALYYPKQTESTLYQNLMHQCKASDIPIVDLPDLKVLNENYGLVVDALFGFSFKPPVRPLFAPVMSSLVNTTTPVCSVDVPSGWDIDKGPMTENDLKPDLLVSLTAPKLCANYFKGRFHFLGGRFVPPALAAKYDLDLPAYPGTDCCVNLSQAGSSTKAAL